MNRVIEFQQDRRRKASASGHGAGAAAVTARRRLHERIGRVGDLACWVLIAYAVTVLAVAIWRARYEMVQFAESPAFTAAPVPGARP